MAIYAGQVSIRYLQRKVTLNLSEVGVVDYLVGNVELKGGRCAWFATVESESLNLCKFARPEGHYWSVVYSGWRPTGAESCQTAELIASRECCRSS